MPLLAFEKKRMLPSGFKKMLSFYEKMLYSAFTRKCSRQLLTEDDLVGLEREMLSSAIGGKCPRRVLKGDALVRYWRKMPSLAFRKYCRRRRFQILYAVPGVFRYSLPSPAGDRIRPFSVFCIEVAVYYGLCCLVSLRRSTLR